MKPFVIKAPAKGKNTASIVAQVYDKAERRTKTVYVASFSVASSPDSAPACVKLASAAAAAGFTLELATALVQPWLKLNSTFGHPKQFDPELVEQVRRELAAEGSNRVLIEGQDDLALIETVLRGATVSLVAEAAALHQRGLKLTRTQRCVETVAHEGANALDVLQARANNIRLKLVPAFVKACQDAKLMVKKGGAA